METGWVWVENGNDCNEPIIHQNSHYLECNDPLSSRENGANLQAQCGFRSQRRSSTRTMKAATETLGQDLTEGECRNAVQYEINAVKGAIEFKLEEIHANLASLKILCGCLPSCVAYYPQHPSAQHPSAQHPSAQHPSTSGPNCDENFFYEAAYGKSAPSEVGLKRLDGRKDEKGNQD
jgi:hypothetical protein